MDEKWFKLRKKIAGVTNADIAAKIGRDHTVISKLVAGTQKMTFEYADIIAQALDVPAAEVLEKFGAIDARLAQELTPGFRESDAAPFIEQGGKREKINEIARIMGGDRPGVDVWQIKSRAMALAGFLAGDYILVDSYIGERLYRGDTVIAQVYNNATATASTILRTFHPPVLVAAGLELDEAPVHVVDGINVSIRGKVIGTWRF